MIELESSVSRDNQKSNSSSTTFSTSPVSFSALFGDCLKIDLSNDRLPSAPVATRIFNDGELLDSGDMVCVPASDSGTCMELSTSQEELNGYGSTERTVRESPADYDSGCQCEEQCRLTADTVVPKKKRGGWPKGKKRKERSTEIKVPKAPSTGYVIYLNERGREMRESQPELPFSEVTKILGREWTEMTTHEKQKYLNRAEEDKKRYREELKAFQHLEAYQVFLKKKKLKNHHSIENDQSPSFTLHDIEEESVCDLYCEVCKQFFVSLHNKKEHLYGRQHLQAIAGELHKTTEEGETAALPLEEETSVGNNRRLLCSGCDHKRPGNVSKAIQDLLSLALDRESEVKHLQQRLTSIKELITSRQEQLQVLREEQKSRNLALQSLKAEGVALTTQLVGLRMVPQLFGVIKF